jgi:hypothetical protein
VSASQSSGTGASSVEVKAGDAGGMEPAEHDLLVELRRARRSLRLQDMDEPPAVARLTPGAEDSGRGAAVIGSWSFVIVPERDPFRLDNRQPGGRDQGPGPLFILLNLALSFKSAYAAPVIMMRQNRQQGIDRRAAENDGRINVKAELEIELLHEKIDQLREREILKLTGTIRMLTELLDQSTSGAPESNAEDGLPSLRAVIEFMA